MDKVKILLQNEADTNVVREVSSTCTCTMYMYTCLCTCTCLCGFTLKGLN